MCTGCDGYGWVCGRYTCVGDGSRGRGDCSHGHLGGCGAGQTGQGGEAVRGSQNSRKLLQSIPPSTKETVLEYIRTHGATKSNTPQLYQEIGKSSYRGLEDVLRYLEETEGLLIREKQGKTHYWRLKDKGLIAEKLSQKDAINLNYAIELNKDEFSPDTIKTLKKMFTSNSKTLLGNLSISEELNDETMNKNYDLLTEAIANHYYVQLHIDDTAHKKIYKEVKPIRIIFMSDNWYLAFEYSDNSQKKFQFSRLVFIKRVKYCKDEKFASHNSFQAQSVEKYIEFIKSAQSSMTLYGKESKTATIQALPRVAKYFDKGMKTFLSSQKFSRKLDDGSVIFTLEYTQPLEILPIIQKWMPDLIIIAPEELRKEYIAKLKKTLKHLTDKD